MSPTATQSQHFADISATTAPFALEGGKYALTISATWSSGSAQLEILSLDAVTWINAGSSITVNGLLVYDLPPGQYRLAITSATAIYAALTTISE